MLAMVIESAVRLKAFDYLGPFFCDISDAGTRIKRGNANNASCLTKKILASIPTAIWSSDVAVLTKVLKRLSFRRFKICDHMEIG